MNIDLIAHSSSKNEQTPVTVPKKYQAKDLHVIRRNGELVSFDEAKVKIAMSKAFLAVEGGEAKDSTRIHETVEKLSQSVLEALVRRMPATHVVHIEDIQDQVELALMREGEHQVVRSYILYREEHARQREQKAMEAEDLSEETAIIHVVFNDGSRQPLDINRLQTLISESCQGLNDVSVDLILQNVHHNLFDGISQSELHQILIMGARGFIEQHPNYSLVTARLLLDSLRTEVLSFFQNRLVELTHQEMVENYPRYFKRYIRKAVELELLHPDLLKFDLDILAQNLQANRDLKFNYLGLQTLYDRYFQHYQEQRIELPQAFFMRVAMGLALNEPEKEQRAIEFYQLLSSFDFMSSTPTLFNSGTLRPQLSSCYLSTVDDSAEGITKTIADNALLSKFAGGIGNDWTPVRAMGAYIKGTNGKSNGVIPFLKMAETGLIAFNQSGKRKGAGCAYLETWHLDIEDFLELRKNTGDDRRRTHDMNTANWVPDLFLKRVENDEMWTLFSPDEVPDLHDLYGQDFETAYVNYEKLAQSGELKHTRRISAVQLWRKMLTMLFETGHPWIAFKDPCNLRSPQQHEGVVHGSNLCTEVTLNTSYGKEVSVCNLGSINLPAHVTSEGLDKEKLKATVGTAMRMLDNVIDINYYSIDEARNSNLKHRPVGLGIMGFQDALYQQKIAYASQEAVEFADSSMELVSYYAIEASTELAKERGCYESFDGSLWSQGILPIDSMKQFAEYRQQYLEVDLSSRLDWEALRQKVVTVGMRNSNCLAIAPTATISNIVGVSQSIEPTFKNLFVKSNLSGEFTCVNAYLVRLLKSLDLWDTVMVNDLKYYEGSVEKIERVPEYIKQMYATAFEIDQKWLVEAASRRQKWIDQAQSLNFYMAEPSGRKLDELYRLAWLRGLKTTYYLRSQGATHMGKNNAIADENMAPKVCAIDDPDCEACQ